MGVYVKGMSMPHSCWECTDEDRAGLNVTIAVNGAKCPFTEKIITREEFDMHSNKRHPACPLVEVAEPHGRIVDEKMITEVKYRLIEDEIGGNLKKQISNITSVDAPTVIPSED